MTEIGYYDLPAAIDEILKVSGYSQLYFIGYSMGSTLFFMMASLRPEYNKKIKSSIHLAPLADVPTMEEVVSPLMRLLYTQAELLHKLAMNIGMYEFLPRTPKLIKFIKKVCSPSVQQAYCFDAIGETTGENRQNLDSKNLGNFACHVPTGTSLNVIFHYIQTSKAGFRQFNYGIKENRRRYNSDQPPLYPLHNVTAPMIFYWSENDLLITRDHLMRLVKQFPNTIEIYVVPDSKFNHVDYMLGVNKVKVVYNDVVSYLLKIK